MLKHIKNIKQALALGLVITILLSLSSFEANCEELRQKVFRLHIIANSNSEFDQTLKLKIRDAVISKTGDIYDKCTSVDEAKQKAEENKKIIYENLLLLL